MDLSRLLLLTGVAVEGVLIAYQIYVAETLCAYCLILFAIVLLLNALAGGKQSLAGISILSGMILISSMLSYGPTALLSKQQTINSGTYGTRTCLNPQKELYLFFSADCPHCKNVLQALEGCSSCNFHFNPIEKLDKFDLKGTKRTASYDPELNKLLLKLLGIDSIPVLLEKNQSGFSIIKGEKQIIHYIQQACYLADPLLYLNTEGQSSQNPIPVFNEEGECSLNIECEKEGTAKITITETLGNGIIVHHGKRTLSKRVIRQKSTRIPGQVARQGGGHCRRRGTGIQYRSQPAARRGPAIHHRR